MKKYFSLLILITLFFSQKTFAQTSDSTVNALLAIDESLFINKPLDSIIAVLPAGYTEIRIFAGGHYYTARFLRIKYPNDVGIILHVRNFTHMNPVDTNRVWNLSLMRKEPLYKTVIYKHVDCYRNCDTY